MCLFHIACGPICSFERFALAALLLRFSCSFNDPVHHGFLLIQLFSLINTNINQYESILKCHICHYGSHHHLTKTVAFVMVCCLALLCVFFSIILFCLLARDYVHIVLALIIILVIITTSLIIKQNV